MNTTQQVANTTPLHLLVPWALSRSAKTSKLRNVSPENRLITRRAWVIFIRGRWLHFWPSTTLSYEVLGFQHVVLTCSSSLERMSKCWSDCVLWILASNHSSRAHVPPLIFNITRCLDERAELREQLKPCCLHWHFGFAHHYSSSWALSRPSDGENMFSLLTEVAF